MKFVAESFNVDSPYLFVEENQMMKNASKQETLDAVEQQVRKRSLFHGIDVSIVRNEDAMVVLHRSCAFKYYFV